MRREALRRRVRLLAQDTTRPYLWQDEDIDDWLNEAQQEAAIRARLLRATPASHPALCEYTLAAGEAAIAVLTAFSVAPSWLPPGALAVLACIVSMAALVARFIAQAK